MATRPDGLRSGPPVLATLATGLRSVAAVAKRFAAPPKSSAEAELAGLLHDLGKYAQRFQARLQDNFIHGNNDWGRVPLALPSYAATPALSRWTVITAELLRGMAMA